MKTEPYLWLAIFLISMWVLTISYQQRNLVSEKLFSDLESRVENIEWEKPLE